MKKAALILALSLLVSTFYFTPIKASVIDIPISLFMNGLYIPSDTPVFIEQNTYFVPVRFVSEALGVSDIQWDSEEQSVTISHGEKVVRMFVGQKTVLINGFEYAIDTAPVLENGRTMVPLNFISEVFDLDFDVTYDSVTRSLLITKEGVNVQALSGQEPYTQEDIIWLARIVHVEAQGLSLNGKLAIANVVLNRKKSDVFPDTVYNVIFQTGQFPPAHKDGFSTLVPTEESLLAAKLAIAGENNIENCLYFNHRPFSWKGDPYKIIEGEYFYN